MNIQITTSDKIVQVGKTLNILKHIPKKSQILTSSLKAWNQLLDSLTLMHLRESLDDAALIAYLNRLHTKILDAVFTTPNSILFTKF